MRPRAALSYAIPTSLLLFCWLTMGESAAYDNDVFTAYGFPLSWYTPSIISSGGYEIAIGRAIIDFAIYAVLAQLAWVAFATAVSMTPSTGRTIKGLLWFTSAVSLFLSLAAFSIDPHPTWWSLSPHAPQNVLKSHFTSIGLQPRRPTPRNDH